MKKLSLKNILLEAEAVEKTGRAIGLSKKPVKQPPNIGMDQTVPAQTQALPVGQRVQSQEDLQDKIDNQENMSLNPAAYNDLRNSMEQYKQSNGSYVLPDNFVNQLIKQFGSLEDAAISIFGSGASQERVQLIPQRTQQSIPQINQQAQQLKQQRPMPQQDQSFEPTPEEEEEANSFARRKEQIFKQAGMPSRPQQPIKR